MTTINKFICSLGLLSIINISNAQITFPWNGTYGGSGANRTYSTTVSGVTMSATINNSENVFQDASPKFFATSSVFPSSGCAGLPAVNEGMLLSTDWTTNTTKTVITTITFSQPVQAPINFSLYDINDDGSGSWRDKITISASNSIGPVNISKVGTLCIETGGSVSGNGTTLLTLNAGSSSACTCWGNNSINVGAATDCVTSIVITYGSMNTSYNNPKQYVVISKLTTTAPGAVTTGTAVTNNCGNSVLTASGGGLYSWSNSLGSSSTANTSVAGTYTVTVTNNKGCQKATTVVAAPKAFPVPTSSFNCAQANTIKLTASGGGTYSWTGPNSFSNSTATPTISSATASNFGTYTVSVTAANGCVATSTTDVNSIGCSLLPVDLMLFKGTCENNKAVFNWSTSSEKNNIFFILEKSKDGVIFDEIGRIKGEGNSTETKNYYLSFENNEYATFYYRLKQVDFSGKYNYSEVISVSCDKKGLFFDSIRLFPNPVDSYLSIDLGDIIKSDLRMTIIDALGREIKNIILQPNDPSIITVNTSDIANGIYVFKITDSKNQALAPFIKFIKQTDLIVK